MRYHPKDDQVQAYGCATLLALTEGSAPDARAEELALLAEATPSPLELLEFAMADYPMNLRIHSSARHVLACLAPSALQRTTHWMRAKWNDLGLWQQNYTGTLFSK